MENVQRDIMAIPAIYPRNAKIERHNEDENGEDNITQDTYIR